MPLNSLIKFDKDHSLDLLQQTSEEDLWDTFLTNQVDLFFDHEIQWLKKNLAWSDINTVLEIGSGNGAFLATLSNEYPDKQFSGFDKNELFVTKSNQSFNNYGLNFLEGDAETFDPSRENSTDAIVFRFTLEHLNEPFLALEHACNYLKPNGKLIIIETFDSGTRLSHPMPTIQGVTKEVDRIQQKQKGEGNRRISCELVKELASQNRPLGKLYEIEANSLESKSEELKHSIYLSKEYDRKRLSNQLLLFLAIYEKKYGLSIDWETAYDEVKAYLENDDAWVLTKPHYLVLSKN